MYEFDAILIDDEACSIASVSIMHDPDADTFALVEGARETSASQSNPEADKLATQPAWPIDWDRLGQDHEIAFLRGDLATSSPESYTIGEMREISEAMDASTVEVETAIHADFNSMTPYAQGMMLDLLKEADPDNYRWWSDLLVSPIPSSFGQLSAPSHH